MKIPVRWVWENDPDDLPDDDHARCISAGGERFVAYGGQLFALTTRLCTRVSTPPTGNSAGTFLTLQMEYLGLDWARGLAQQSWGCDPFESSPSGGDAQQAAGVALLVTIADALAASPSARVESSSSLDRTGWAAASLLLLLGVPDDLVMKEYLLTNAELLPAEQPMLDRFRALGGDPDVLRPVVEVAPDYLEAALAEMRKTFGTIEAYFAEGLSVDEAAQKALVAALIEGGRA